MPLSDASFIWTYFRGNEQLSNARLNAVTVRHHLLVFMRDEPVLRFGLFKWEYDKVMSQVGVD